MILATFSQEPLYFIVCGLVTLGFGYIVIFYSLMFFVALIEWLFKLKIYSMDPFLKREIEYGDYVLWAAKNGKITYLHKDEMPVDLTKKQ